MPRAPMGDQLNVELGHPGKIFEYIYLKKYLNK